MISRDAILPRSSRKKKRRSTGLPGKFPVSQGMGILYSYDDHRIHESLAAGKLRRVLTDWSPTLPGLFLYYSGRRDPPPALRAFIDCLLGRDVPREGARSRALRQR